MTPTVQDRNIQQFCTFPSLFRPFEYDLSDSILFNSCQHGIEFKLPAIESDRVEEGETEKCMSYYNVNTLGILSIHFDYKADRIMRIISSTGFDGTCL